MSDDLGRYHDRAWEMWLEKYPEDEPYREVITDTFEWHRLVLAATVEDAVGPAKAAMTAMVDQLDAHMARLRDEGLRAALRHWRT